LEGKTRKVLKVLELVNDEPMKPTFLGQSDDLKTVRKDVYNTALKTSLDLLPRPAVCQTSAKFFSIRTSQPENNLRIFLNVSLMAAEESKTEKVVQIPLFLLLHGCRLH